MGKLTALKVKSLKEPGRYSDGGNLYLRIARAGAKSWVFFYRFGEARHDMGLGSAVDIPLEEARAMAREAQNNLKRGINPLEARDAAKKAEASKQTFGAFADDYVKAHEAKFRNVKHAAQWKATLGPNYCSAIRGLPIGKVDTEAVLKVLRPIWQTTPETAARIRGRIENVIDAAKARGLYQGDNPARWKGHLKAVLPARQRLSRGHHAALPYDDLPAFMDRLCDKQADSVAAYALEFCILTATRTSETLDATWAEIDTVKGLWTIPATRMKAGVEHRVPLSPRALEILSAVKATKGKPTDFIFPGSKRGKPLSNMAMAMLLKGMEVQATVHGFRSTFRDWASEQTSFPHEVCEMALAHTIGNKAEAAYRRGDLFEKRRKLMEAWQMFAVLKKTEKVLHFKR